ncbi:SIS domain-containing protein [Sutcliffiella horikoshii]|uniref:SIS domain-containing protein n=1 Tax=Sutcliffiella horikoshii TaxID=79883 RepID=UPI003850C015
MEFIQTNKWDQNNPGAIHTTREIAQQPRLWKETVEILLKHRDTLMSFFKKIDDRHPHIRVILTGAGTSAFVGETVLTSIKEMVKHKRWTVESIPTTDIVSNPYEYLDKDIPTLMISFARSGNSPESVGSVELGEQIIDHFYGIALTCNRDGLLAKQKKGDPDHLVIFMPKEANDQGFAMTSSFTTMLLSGLLVFQPERVHTLEKTINEIVSAGAKIIETGKTELEALASSNFSKVVYLGSGVFQGLARESSLKLLELTGGMIPAIFDSPLGFRHGPKSILDEKTIVFVFLSCHPYTRKYDLDVLKELYHEQKRGKVVAISSYQDDVAERYSNLFLTTGLETVQEDIFLTFPYVMYAQQFALCKSMYLGLSPDNPSPMGLVNRVVKGVKIYPYRNGGERI